MRTFAKIQNMALTALYVPHSLDGGLLQVYNKDSVQDQVQVLVPGKDVFVPEKAVDVPLQSENATIQRL